MGHHPVIDIHSEPRSLKAVSGRVARLAGILGVIALGASLGLGSLIDKDLAHFQHSYLVSFCYFMSVSLGAIFFLGITNLCSARWSIVIRRVAEVIAANIGIIAVLALPILIPMALGSSGLYVWNQADVPEEIAHKRAYLNFPFFAIRVVGYFSIWLFMARYYLGWSLTQDRTGGHEPTDRMKGISAPGLILFGLTITFASFDFLMSLYPTWVSTIFGVYYFGGSALAFFAFLIVGCQVLQRSGYLPRAITIEHYHDLGKFLFGFTFFWGYIAFSQYMLIWYGNLPEETWWYRDRTNGSWVYVSLLLIFGHFIIPFVALMGRHVKRTPLALGFWAVWLLLMRYVDLYWLVMPQLYPERMRLALVDGLIFLGVGGLYLAGLLWIGGTITLVPERDPYLTDSLAFRNI